MPNQSKMDEAKTIMRNLEKAGFPLEVECTEILREDRWDVSNQVAFIDPDENKYRSVDLVASRLIFRKEIIDLNVELVVECKKSDKPWLFYTSKDIAIIDIFLSSVQLRSGLSESEIRLYRKNRDLSYIADSFLSTHLRIHKEIAKIPLEPLRKGGNPITILDATMKVCKYILYDRENRIRIMDRIHKPLFPLNIALPLIVFDGHLYAYESNRLKLIQSTLYHFDYLGVPFLFDIVTKDFLQNYLSNINKEAH